MTLQFPKQPGPYVWLMFLFSISTRTTKFGGERVEASTVQGRVEAVRNESPSRQYSQSFLAPVLYPLCLRTDLSSEGSSRCRCPTTREAFFSTTWHMFRQNWRH